MMNRQFIAWNFLAFAFAAILLNACNKPGVIENRSHQPSSYSSEVLDKWMTLQIRLMRNPTGIANQAFSRHYAYAGIAALESLAPGLPAHHKWSQKWNGLSGLPAAGHGKTYYYPANVNAALAAINRSLFPGASIVDKQAIDSLELALNQEFLSTESASLIASSNAFGKAVAQAVYQWSETDGYKLANAPYTPPAGPGLWKPTPPAMASAATPYWGNNRTIIIGSTINALPPAPLPYSTHPSSGFYQMVKKVYDASTSLTDDQKAMAIFWRDVPGTTTPGHWLSIVQQVVKQTNTALDKAALAYAVSGAAINDALISCFQSKYQYNLVRPVTYIREVMGHTGWNSFIGTPAHPEYASAHASLSIAAATSLEKIFGNIGSFTDHTYDYLNLAPRTFSSIRSIGEEAAQSRLYGGIHYQQTIDASLVQGEKVTGNIFSNNNTPSGQ